MEAFLSAPDGTNRNRPSPQQCSETLEKFLFALFAMIVHDAMLDTAKGIRKGGMEEREGYRADNWRQKL